MAGTLLHSPANVTRRLLIDLGLGVQPPALPWPIYDAKEPALPDAVITVYNTSSRHDGRTQIDGEVQEHHGVQVRVRALTDPTGWAKARAIALALDGVYDRTATIQGVGYLVHSYSRSTDVLSLGEEADSSRKLYTINALMAVRQVN